MNNKIFDVAHHSSKVEKELIRDFLGTIVLIFIICVISAPYYLIIQYPDSAPSIVLLSKTFIPWLLVFILILVFHEGIKGFFGSISNAVNRIVEGEWAGGKIKLRNAQDGGVELTPEQVDQVKTQIQNLQAGQTQTTHLLSIYYHQYIYNRQFIKAKLNF